MKVVKAKRTERRCGVCSSGNRERFDGYLQLYLNGEPDESGDKLTWPRLEILSGVLTGTKLDKRSLRRHLDGHSIVVDDAQAQVYDAEVAETDEERDQLLAEIDALLESGDVVSPQGLLAVQMRSYLLSLRSKLVRGDEVLLTHDQAQRAATAMVSSQKSHEQASILNALTAGIGAVFTKAFQENPLAVDGEVVREIESAEVVGEVVGEDEDEAA
jgi:hypothetical protein